MKTTYVKSAKSPDPPTAAKPLLAAAVPCSHEDIYLRKSGIWKCKQCGKVFY
jgi:hypothetical protein